MSISMDKYTCSIELTCAKKSSLKGAHGASPSSFQVQLVIVEEVTVTKA